MPPPSSAFAAGTVRRGIDHDLLVVGGVHAVVEHGAGLVAVGAREQDRVGGLEVRVGVEERRVRAEVLGDRGVLGVPLGAVVDRPHGDALVGAAALVVEAARRLGEEEPRLDEVLLGREVVGAPEADRRGTLRVERLLEAVGDQVERLVPARVLEVAALLACGSAASAAARSASSAGARGRCRR